jgi:hypothetical protein
MNSLRGDHCCSLQEARPPVRWRVAGRQAGRRPHCKLRLIFPRLPCHGNKERLLSGVSNCASSASHSADGQCQTEEATRWKRVNSKSERPVNAAPRTAQRCTAGCLAQPYGPSASPALPPMSVRPGLGIFAHAVECTQFESIEHRSRRRHAGRSSSAGPEALNLPRCTVANLGWRDVIHPAIQPSLARILEIITPLRHRAGRRRNPAGRSLVDATALAVA